MKDGEIRPRLIRTRKRRIPVTTREVPERINLADSVAAVLWEAWILKVRCIEFKFFYVNRINYNWIKQIAGRLDALPKNHPAMVKAWAVVKQGGQRVRDELKRPEEIEKARKLKEKARLRSGPKEARMKVQQNRKKPVLKTKQKKGGKRRRWFRESIGKGKADTKGERSGGSLQQNILPVHHVLQPFDVYCWLFFPLPPQCADDCKYNNWLNKPCRVSFLCLLLLLLSCIAIDFRLEPRECCWFARNLQINFTSLDENAWGISYFLSPLLLLFSLLQRKGIERKKK